jgi:hypothetical protein
MGVLSRKKSGRLRRAAFWAAGGGLLSTTMAFSALAATTTAAPNVWLVGPAGYTDNGVAPQFATIQEALAVAKPGDWILVAPGDYKTPTGTAPAGASTTPAGVLVTTPGIHIRGLDRNGVVIDGTKSGPACSNAAADQSGNPLNGIMVWKADNVSVENLTVCNFMAGPGTNTGNEIWWNGGANSAKIGGWGYTGRYLTATSTYFGGESTAAEYGIFSSNWSGGEWNHTYASNFNDSGYYIGACQNQCDQIVNHAWAEYNALGYSGSNSGGTLVVEHSQFDHNEDGFDTNSQNGDNPPPQDGACPNGGISPITHTHSCWVFMDNYVHDNNNPDVPSAGSAAAGPVGTGMSLSGARDDTVMDNVFANNGAWGTILVPYPDSGPPCSGGTYTPAICLFDEWGDAIIGNTYEHNGFFGNPTNGDIGAGNFEPGPTDCFGGNVEMGGGAVTTSPPLAESLYPECTGMTVPPDLNGPFLAEVACDSEAISIGPITGGQTCLPNANYPRRTTVNMPPLPPASSLPGMKDACKGVPTDPWCPAG